MFGFNLRKTKSPDLVQSIANETEAQDAHEKRSGWSLADPGDMWGWLAWGGAPTLAGIEVGPESALRCAPARNAVELISNVCGTLPVKLLRRAASGGSEPATDHSGFDLVTGQANGWTSAGAFRTALTVDALTWGDGLGFVNRDSTGQPVEYIRLIPGACTIELDPLTQEPIYLYDATGQQRVFAYGDIVHIRPTAPLNYLGLRGLAPIRSGKEAIALALTLERYGSRLMASGGRPSGILKFPQKLSPQSATKMKTSWESATSGASAGGTAVLEEGGDFQQLAFSSVDAQFMQMREFAVIEIARHFGIPPSFLQDYGRATWNNIVQANRMLVVTCLEHWFQQWEDAYNRTLLSDADRKAGYSVCVDRDSLLQGDLTARANAYSTLIAARVLNPNEARARENLPAYDGGDQFQNPNTTPAAPVTRPDKGQDNDD